MYSLPFFSVSTYISLSFIKSLNCIYILFCGCYRSTSSQTSHSENSSSSDSQKTPLIIVNLKIAPDVITMAKNNSRQQNNLNRKLPPFCTNYQKQSQSTPNKTSSSVSFNAIQDANMKVINDFIIQGTVSYQ